MNIAGCAFKLLIRAKNIDSSFLNKDFNALKKFIINAYYHSVNLLKGKDKLLALLLMVTPLTKDIVDCIAESYKTVFNDVGYDKAAMSELF